MSLFTVRDRANLLRDARADMLRSTCPFSAIYAGHGLYLSHSTWLQVPQDPMNAPFSLLCHNSTGKFYCSSVVGIVNTEDLHVEPPGVLRVPELQSSSQYRFSLSTPDQFAFCDGFTQDYKVAFDNTKILFHSLCDDGVENQLCSEDGKFHFVHQRFLKIGHQCAGIYNAVVRRQAQYILPFPVRSGYHGILQDRFNMAAESELAVNGYPHDESTDGIFDYDIVPFTVRQRGQELQTEDIPGALAGSLVSVEYTVSADRFNGFFATVSEVNILLTSDKLSLWV